MSSVVSSSARVGLAILRSRLLGRRTPVVANILITNRCNLRCFYCYPNVFGRRLPDMPLESFRRIVDLLAAKGTRMIEFLGGEPFLLGNLHEYVSYAKTRGLVCEITTNGYFVGNHLQSLPLFDSVCVSLDGDEAAHDLNRGRGSWGKAMAAIDLLQSRGVLTRIKAVVTRNNRGELPWLAELARERRMVLMLIAPTIYEDRAYPAGTQGKWLTGQEYHDVILTAIRLKREGYPIFHSRTALAFCRDWPHPFDRVLTPGEARSLKRKIRCTARYYQVFIDVDGTYFMSCQKRYDLKGAAILETDFDEWWQDPDSHGCGACAVLPQLDKSLVYNLHPEALWNMVRNVLFHGQPTPPGR